ncbi:hypothetical protein NDU88_005708 [Pleurodeles waltl]|uniref:Uncharacterized protein n=1 Tax=Pleurodeles waltl TaxID=8319 RepID=A0AAV7NPR5_PLEWA|nr:hypothetical protein NDU88_005708 [Pleurodeles waltl]
MSRTLRHFSFCWVGTRRSFSPQESDASIRSALSGPVRPCLVFTRPVVLTSEIQPHDDPKTTQCGLRSLSLRQRCCVTFLLLRASILQSRFQLASIFSCRADGALFFQPQIGVASIFSPHGTLCMDFLLLACQLLLSGPQELDGHHRAE